MPAGRGRRGEEGEQEMREAEEEEEGDEGMEPSFGGLAAGAGPGGRRALQVELPAQLGMEPEDLQRIRWGAGGRTGLKHREAGSGGLVWVGGAVRL